MRIAEQLPKLSAGVVTPALWNRAAGIINKLSSVSVGQGMRMSFSASGIHYDTVPEAYTQKSFPFGRNYGFGLEFAVDNGVLDVRVWNPFVSRSGICISNWWNQDTLPDQNFVSVSIAQSDWAVAGNVGRICIVHRYDQSTSTDSIIKANTPAQASTLPTSDGGGILQPLQYILTPLYVLSCTRNTSNEPFSNFSLHMDLIHNKLELPLQA